MHLPANPLDRVIDAASAGSDTLARLARLVPRVSSIVDSAEELIVRAAELLSRLEQGEERMQHVISRVADSEQAARDVIDAVARLEARAERILDRYEPTVTTAAETLAYAVEQVGREQVDAVVAYLAAAPLIEQIEYEVLPTMQTFKTLAPDLTELLAVSKALNEMMGSVPGLGRAKKRIDNELAQDDA